LISDDSSDRQIVLLGDPMAKVMPVPDVPPEVGALQTQIDIDVAEMTGPEMMGRVIEWHESEEWSELEALADEMADLHDGTVEETIEERDGVRTIKRVRITGKDMTPEQREALAAKLEAKSAELEAKMATREAEMDAHDANIERKMTILEHRIENNAGEIERIMEERFGPAFEARVEAQSAVIEQLVETCEAAVLAKGETRIVEQADVDGDVVRLACVEGGRERLKAAETLAAVNAHPGITAAEKAAFDAAAAGEKRKQVMIFRSGSSEAHEYLEAPEPPQAPEAPEAPDAPLDGE
jgi:hypothetical protein